MENKEADSFSENIRICYVGLRADTGAINVEELLLSLTGWKDFWQVSTSVFLQRKLTLRPLPPERRPRIYVGTFTRGSFDVFLNVILPVGLMVSYDLAKNLWNWRRNLLSRHIDTKKSLTITEEEIVGALEKLARAHELSIADDKAETWRLIERIDESLQNAVDPIGCSATKLTISSDASKDTVSLEIREKQILQSAFVVDPAALSQGFQEAKVKFIRINTDTGNALITFKNPIGLHQYRHVYSVIKDPAIKQPRNVYTRAHYEDSPLKVWARMVRRRKDNAFASWEITAIFPKEDTPLLDSMQGGPTRAT